MKKNKVYIVEIEDEELLTELFDDLDKGPIIDDDGNRFLIEHYVDTVKGGKVEIFSNEHPPPHFSVSYQGKKECYTIDECTPIFNTLKSYNRNVKKWWLKNKEKLISIWDEKRPSDCSVGKFKTKEKI